MGREVDTLVRFVEEVQDCWKEIHIQYTPKLSRDISNYPSGHSLRKVNKKFD
jgi:hypothetical protein